jgi:hypothetical protein
VWLMAPEKLDLQTANEDDCRVLRFDGIGRNAGKVGCAGSADAR